MFTPIFTKRNNNSVGQIYGANKLQIQKHSLESIFFHSEPVLILLFTGIHYFLFRFSLKQNFWYSVQQIHQLVIFTLL